MSATSTLTQRHRAQQLLLRRATIAQLATIWPALNWDRLDETYPGFALQVASLVERNRQTSSGLAAAYLRAFRRASGMPGEIKPVFAQPLIVDQFQASLHSTSVASIKANAGRGMAAEQAMALGLGAVQNSMSRLVLNAGRETTLLTAASDGRAIGYRRILGGGGCDFCQKLAGRVYPTDNADFEAHGKCGCTSEPVYA